eukprot:gene756-800_t
MSCNPMVVAGVGLIFAAMGLAVSILYIVFASNDTLDGMKGSALGSDLTAGACYLASMGFVTMAAVMQSRFLEEFTGAGASSVLMLIAWVLFVAGVLTKGIFYAFPFSFGGFIIKEAVSVSLFLVAIALLFWSLIKTGKVIADSETKLFGGTYTTYESVPQYVAAPPKAIKKKKNRKKSKQWEQAESQRVASGPTVISEQTFSGYGGTGAGHDPSSPDTIPSMSPVNVNGNQQGQAQQHLLPQEVPEFFIGSSAEEKSTKQFYIGSSDVDRTPPSRHSQNV